MEYYAGIDVSLKSSSICVADGSGRIIREAKVSSEPDALRTWFKGWSSAWLASVLKQILCLNGFHPQVRQRANQLVCIRTVSTPSPDTRKHTHYPNAFASYRWSEGLSDRFWSTLK